MPFNGSGTFTLSIGGFPYVANTTIVSANVNALIQDIANGLSLTVTRDGQMTLTGPLHMGSQLIDGIKNLQFSTTTSSPPVSSDGWFLTAAHTLGLATNGTVGLSQNSTGNVSIATPSSGTAFTANGIANGTHIVAADGTVTGAIQTNGGNTLVFGTTSNHALNLRTNGADRITTSNAGNVVINVPGSGNTLTVTGISGSSAVAANGGSGSTVYNAATAGSFGTGLNVSGPAANGLNAIVFQQSGQTQWAFYQAASDSTFRLAGGGTDRLTITSGGAATLTTPSSGNHQFNGLTQYSDGTTNAEIGWRSLPVNNQSGAYTLVVADRSKLIIQGAAANITVPNAVFSAGDVVLVENNQGSAITLVQGASFTLRLAGTSTTGSRTLASNGVASILFTSSSSAVTYGAGVS